MQLALGAERERESVVSAMLRVASWVLGGAWVLDPTPFKFEPVNVLRSASLFGTPYYFFLLFPEKLQGRHGGKEDKTTRKESREDDTDDAEEINEEGDPSDEEETRHRGG